MNDKEDEVEEVEVVKNIRAKSNCKCCLGKGFVQLREFYNSPSKPTICNCVLNNLRKYYSYEYKDVAFATDDRLRVIKNDKMDINEIFIEVYKINEEVKPDEESVID